MQYLHKSIRNEVDFLPADTHKSFYKMIVSLWLCAVRHSQSTQNNRFTISLEYVKENMKDVDFLPADKRWRFLQSDTIILGVCGQAYPYCTQNNKFPISLQHLKNEVSDAIDFFNESMKTCFKLILWFWWRWPSISKAPKIASFQCLYNISKKKLEMKLIFLKSFLQVDFNTSMFSTKVILSLLMGTI